MAGRHGQKPFFDSSGDNTAQTMKAADGYLFFLEVSNPNSVDAFLQLFDALVANVTVGSTPPELSFFVPAGASATLRGAMEKDFGDEGLHFDVGIAYACTTTPTGNTNPSTGLTLNATYR